MKTVLKKKLRKKKSQKAYFIQDWGSYSNETLVVVAMNGDEILSAMKRLKIKKDVIDKFKEEKVTLDRSWFVNNNCAMCWIYEGRTILWLRDWKEDWDHYETLLHECFHLIHNVLQVNKNMANEDEGCAYELEFLFRSMRRKLYKKFPNLRGR